MFLNQANFPRLWLLFQLVCGGAKDKQRFALSAWRGQKSILEIGCLVGNIADAFRPLKGVTYTGVDIDKKVIAVAQSRFAGIKNFTFLVESAEALASKGSLYDYILIAGMLHHVDLETARDIISTTRYLSTPDTTIVIYDPDTLTPEDPAYMHWFYKLEQGQFMRANREIEKIILDTSMHTRDKQLLPQRPDFPGFPAVARFSCFTTSWTAQ